VAIAFETLAGAMDASSARRGAPTPIPILLVEGGVDVAQADERLEGLDVARLRREMDEHLLHGVTVGAVCQCHIDVHLERQAQRLGADVARDAEERAFFRGQPGEAPHGGADRLSQRAEVAIQRVDAPIYLRVARSFHGDTIPFSGRASRQPVKIDYRRLAGAGRGAGGARPGDDPGRPAAGA